MAGRDPLCLIPTERLPCDAQQWAEISGRKLRTRVTESRSISGRWIARYDVVLELCVAVYTQYCQDEGAATNTIVLIGYLPINVSTGT